MIVKEDLLKKIKAAFDLNIYEAKIWVALLSKGLAAAGELSDISSVPRSRSYDVLESLEKKGFVLMKLGKPIKYLAIKPEEIVRRIKDHVQMDATSKIEFLDNVRSENVFTELQLLYDHGVKKVDPYSLMGSVRGRDNIYAQLKEMFERAKKSVTIVTSAQELGRKAKKLKNHFARLHERGVQIRIAAPVSDVHELQDLKNIVKIKQLDGAKSRFVVVDDSEMLFMVSDDSDVHEDYDTAVWVNTPYFTKAFLTMFNKTWNELADVKK